MERLFNDHNCKISSILKSINLEHLHSKFVERHVTLDVFLNLTEDDLDYLEITNEKERNILLNDLNMYQPQYADILTPRKFNHTKMLLTSLHQLDAINSLTSTILNQVTRAEATQTQINRLIDDVTPVTKVVTILNQQMLTSLDYIEQDIKQQLDVYEGRKPRNRLITAGVIISCIAISGPALFFLIRNQVSAFQPQYK